MRLTLQNFKAKLTTLSFLIAKCPRCPGGHMSKSCSLRLPYLSGWKAELTRVTQRFLFHQQPQLRYSLRKPQGQYL